MFASKTLTGFISLINLSSLISLNTTLTSISGLPFKGSINNFVLELPLNSSSQNPALVYENLAYLEL